MIVICGYPSYGAIFGGRNVIGGQHDICIIKEYVLLRIIKDNSDTITQ
jgi:hypothetical protein